MILAGPAHAVPSTSMNAKILQCASIMLYVKTAKGVIYAFAQLAGLGQDATQISTNAIKIHVIEETVRTLPVILVVTAKQAGLEKNAKRK